MSGTRDQFSSAMDNLMSGLLDMKEHLPVEIYDGGNFITATFKDTYTAAKFAETYEEAFDVTFPSQRMVYLSSPISITFTYR